MINVHFLNVGQGNMIVVIFPDNKILVYDCNITEDNEESIFNYLEEIMPKYGIDVFVNSHREVDHMRQIKKLHEIYPIGTLWDSGVSGNTDTPEYEEYMDFRRSVTVYEVSAGQYWNDKPNVRILNGKRDGLKDTNAQSIVIHINNNGASVLLTGDTDAKTWRDYIMPESTTKVSSSILLASHHGSITFFDDPRDEKNYYTAHISKINPAMTIISVGDNPHGHPDKKALELYEKYSRGSDKGNKVFRTDINGNMRLELKDNGSWTLHQKQ
jgi:beta-lactamase superfamily II metal-dependent hydrolase